MSKVQADQRQLHGYYMHTYSPCRELPNHYIVDIQNRLPAGAFFTFCVTTAAWSLRTDSNDAR